MMEELLAKGVAKIIATDVSEAALSEARVRTAAAGGRVELRLVPRGSNDVLSEQADIVAPNALGGTLNAETIPRIRAPIVVGAANNQLRDPEADALVLRARGKTFVPDFVANRMGIVTCANEQYGYVQDDPAIQAHFGRVGANAIFNVTQAVLRKAQAENSTSTVAANALADEAAAVPHPIWGHRSKTIVEGLVAEDWHRQPLVTASSG